MARLELLLGCAAGLIFGGEEHPEVLADDLLGAIALHPFGGGRPARDLAVGVEQENRVVLDAVDQQPVALLAFPQRFHASDAAP